LLLIVTFRTGHDLVHYFLKHAGCAVI